MISVLRGTFTIIDEWTFAVLKLFELHGWTLVLPGVAS